MKPGNFDRETMRRVSVDYTMHAVSEFKRKLQPQLPNGTSFKIAYISGVMVERDQEKKLWFADEARHIRVCHLLQHNMHTKLTLAIGRGRISTTEI